MESSIGFALVQGTPANPALAKLDYEDDLQRRQSRHAGYRKSVSQRSREGRNRGMCRTSADRVPTHVSPSGRAIPAQCHLKESQHRFVLLAPIGFDPPTPTEAFAVAKPARAAQSPAPTNPASDRRNGDHP